MELPPVASTHSTTPVKRAGCLPMQLIIMLSIGLIVTVMLRKSVFGMRLLQRREPPGSRPGRRARETCPDHRVRHLGILAAGAGILALSFIGSISPIGARGQEFSVFAAAVIGGASLFGGYGTAAGAILGLCSSGC